MTLRRIRAGKAHGAGRAHKANPAAAVLAAGLAVLLGLAAGPSLSSPASAAQRSRAKRTIVLDPGHGGLDTGAKGIYNNLEKDVTLALAFKLKALIESQLGDTVVLTRDSDIDVSLENRAAVANNRAADVFVSLHANGSFRRKAQGAETFFVSLNASDEETRKLAYMENTSSELEARISEPGKGEKDEIKMILWDMAQAAYVRQSSLLAEEIQRELDTAMGMENRGIKQAPFLVLRGVACPAVLVEAAFISNPEEEQKLVDESFQSGVAQAIFRGLERYLKLYPKG